MNKLIYFFFRFVRTTIINNNKIIIDFVLFINDSNFTKKLSKFFSSLKIGIKM